MSHPTSHYRAYGKRWHIDKIRGISRAYIDADDVRDHIGGYVDEGWPHRAIAKTAGVSPFTVGDIMRGDTEGTQQAVAAALMAVTRRRLYANAKGDDRVPTIGFTRRIQALHVIGYTRTHILDLGVRSDFSKEHVSADRWHAACELYDRLWATPGPSRRGKLKAARAGWAPPLAWDDDTIDDPAAVPAPWRDVTYRGKPRTSRSPGVFLSDAEFLTDAGENLEGAARRLGMTPATLKEMLQSRRRHDVLHRLLRRDQAAS